MTMWAVAGALAVPITVLLHETAHLVTAMAAGLPDATLHFASVHFQDGDAFWHRIGVGDIQKAAEIAAPSRVVLTLAAGPISSVLLAATCAWLLHRGRYHPLLLTTGLFAASRPIFQVNSIWLWLTIGSPPMSVQDESRIAALTRIPEGLLALLGLGVFAFLAPRFLAAINDRRRPHPAWGIASGYLYGILLYWLIVGPLTFP